jgi:hypothetical protein
MLTILIAIAVFGSVVFLVTALLGRPSTSTIESRITDCRQRNVALDPDEVDLEVPFADRHFEARFRGRCPCLQLGTAAVLAGKHPDPAHDGRQQDDIERLRDVLGGLSCVLRRNGARNVRRPAQRILPSEDRILGGLADPGLDGPADLTQGTGQGASKAGYPIASGLTRPRNDLRRGWSGVGCRTGACS